MRSFRPFRTTLVAILVGATLPALAAAQIEAGDKRVSFNGNISKSTDANTDVEGNVQGEYAWYLNRNVALKFGAGVTFAGSTALGIVAAGTELNMASAGQTNIPFLSLDVGTLFGSGLTAYVVEPGIGAHFFLSRQTSFDLQGVYTYVFASAGGASAKATTIEARFGLSFYFGGGEKR